MQDKYHDLCKLHLVVLPVSLFSSSIGSYCDPKKVERFIMSNRFVEYFDNSKHFVLSPAVPAVINGFITSEDDTRMMK